MRFTAASARMRSGGMTIAGRTGLTPPAGKLPGIVTLGRLMVVLPLAPLCLSMPGVHGAASAPWLEEVRSDLQTEIGCKGTELAAEECAHMFVGGIHFW